MSLILCDNLERCKKEKEDALPDDAICPSVADVARSLRSGSVPPGYSGCHLACPVVRDVFALTGASMGVPAQPTVDEDGALRLDCSKAAAVDAPAPPPEKKRKADQIEVSLDTEADLMSDDDAEPWLVVEATFNIDSATGKISNFIEYPGSSLTLLSPAEDHNMKPAWVNSGPAHGPDHNTMKQKSTIVGQDGEIM